MVSVDEQMEMSTIQRLRYGVYIKNELNKLSDSFKEVVYFNVNYSSRNEPLNKIIDLIAIKTKIQKSDNHYFDNSYVNISEYIEFMIDDLHERFIKSKGFGNVNSSHGIRHREEFKVSEKLKQKTLDFEKTNVKLSGPSNTLIGEIFRALQYIEYRANNDGDLPWLLHNPNFVSLIFVQKFIEKFHNKHFDYNDMRTKLKYTDKYLSDLNSECNSYPINSFFETKDCYEVQLTKYQLIDLLESGQIQDEPNNIDSRSFNKIKDENNF